MQFERVVQLAHATPTDVLCNAWGIGPSDVAQRTQGERPMNLREVGALAELHGMKLQDVIAL